MHTDENKPDTAQPSSKPRRTLRRLALHPVGHFLGLLSLHIAALLVIDKTPLLILIGLH